MEERTLADRVAAVSALDEPIRRALLDYVSRSDAPVSRDDVAEAFGLARSTAVFHLDRLAEAGLLAVEFRRLAGRTGPGAGRPSKLYTKAAGEVAVTVPERRYDVAGDLLLDAIEESSRTGAAVKEALRRTAEQAGRTLAAGGRTLEQILEDQGFEPRPDGGGGLVLGNCPFHRLARQHTEIVCQLNLDLLRAAAEAAGDRQHTMILDPGAGRCCVRAVRRRRPSVRRSGGADQADTPATTENPRTDGRKEAR
jgi:predicted ArsR family transcriptional regulator